MKKRRKPWSTNYEADANAFDCGKEKYTLDRSPAYCAHFGCGKRLTYHEKLFGNLCIKHNKIENHEENSLSRILDRIARVKSFNLLSLPKRRRRSA